MSTKDRKILENPANIAKESSQVSTGAGSRQRKHSRGCCGEGIASMENARSSEKWPTEWEGVFVAVFGLTLLQLMLTLPFLVWRRDKYPITGHSTMLVLVCAVRMFQCW